MPWKVAFFEINVELGYRTDEHRLRSHDPPKHHLSARQIAYDSSNFSFEIPLTVSSLPVPSSAPQGSRHQFDLREMGPFVNRQFDLHYPGSLQAAPVAVGCANCTFWGLIDIEFANFAYNGLSKSFSGQATMTAKGVGAHIELLANLVDTWYFTFPLDSLTYALDIADFGVVKFAYADEIAAGYNMKGHVGMNYGFDMSVCCSHTYIAHDELMEV